MPLCLDSADMVPQDWRRIAQDIAQSHNQFDGFVVIMGTDTMAYCASALSFMLEGLSKPVVLTGSMIPFAESYSDARRNLVMALIFAHAGPREVVVFLGIRCSGQPHDEGRRARFVGVRLRRTFLPWHLVVSHSEQGTTWRWRRRRSEDAKRSHRWRQRSWYFAWCPASTTKRYCAASESDELRVVVLELYGTGTAPARRAGLLKALRAARSHSAVSSHNPV